METEDQPEADAISKETIRQRAYEISQRGEDGTPEEDWKQAERELHDEGRLAPPGEPPAP